MTISEHVQTFADLPVEDYDPKKGLQAGGGRTLPAYRLGSAEYADNKHDFPALLASFLDEPGVARVTALVIGAWDYDDMANDGSGAVIEALAAARDRLPNLQALFLGDVTYEECEISWLHQGDVAPLFAAYPRLEHFRVRGVAGLTFGSLQHAALRSLTIESGGLPENIIAEVAAADLPLLGHLELWLGTANYGGIDSPEPLAAILAGAPFPWLRYLGLRDSDIADDVARAVATAPVLERLRVLDLSLGNLSDEGAKALLASPALPTLKKLDIHHHYVSDELVRQLQALVFEVDASDRQSGEGEDRYISVSE